MPFACKICVAERGLKGSEVDELPQTEEELYEHLRTVHGLADESRSQQRRVAAMHTDSVAIDSDGEQFPMSGEDVWLHVQQMANDPDCDIVACIIRNNKTGDIAVPVFGAPDPQIAPILRAAWRGYREAIRPPKGRRH